MHSRALLVAAVACLAAGAASTTVHVVFSNHLDIGFDNIEPLIAYDYNVYLKYWHEYFPRAVQVAEFMDFLTQGQQRYRYLTHAYLVSLFLDCPPDRHLPCPSPELRQQVAAAIRRGVITWHAHPHNAQYELYDPGLLEHSVDFVHDLDQLFGQPPKRTAVLRDVPGLTRAAIPVLAGKGVRAVSVGVNPGSAPPGVPLYTPFIWRDEESGQQLIAFWRPGGYGGIHGGVNLDPRPQCIQAPGLAHVLCTAWRDDNAGPPTNISEPLRIYELLREEWGDATILASTLDAFVEQVEEALPRLNLTVVTGEIGDTWIYGVQSDPSKVADFRSACRARAACLQDPSCPSQGPAFKEFSRMLLKVPEHTWGLDVKKVLSDFVNWTNAGFHPCLQAPRCPNYQALITSWERQAAYLDWAVQALPVGHPVRAAVARDAEQRAGAARTTEEQLLAAGAVEVAVEAGGRYAYTTRHWELQVEGRTGGLTRLKRRYLHRPSCDSCQLCSCRDSRCGGGACAGRGVPRSLRQAAPWPLGGASSSRLPLWRCWRDALQRWMGRLGCGVLFRAAAGARPGACRAAAAAAAACGVGGGSRVVEGVDWAHGSPTPLGQLSYNVYTESDYSVIWDRYSWIPQPLPWWFAQDFGKVNSSAAWNSSVAVQAKLTGMYLVCGKHPSPEPVTEAASGGGSSGGGSGGGGGCAAGRRLEQLYLRYSLPDRLVRDAGAPSAMWQILSFSDQAPQLGVTVVWQNKTATRLPEAVWTSWRPGPAADPTSWAMQKLHSRVQPQEVIRNGSQSMHAVSSVAVRSAAAAGSRDDGADRSTPSLQTGDDGAAPLAGSSGSGSSGSGSSGSGSSRPSWNGRLPCREVLNITTLDAALVSPGLPTPFPIGDVPPAMDRGMHFNLVNNVWGTNYIMWVPWRQSDVSHSDVNLAFRFVVDVQPLPEGDDAPVGGAAGEVA